MLPEPLCRAAEGSAPSPAPPAASGAEADAYLRGYVESWLHQAHRLGPDRVQVKVKDGVVTLAGTADTPEQIDAIVATIGSFAGVTLVVNLLRIEAAAPGAPLEGTGPGSPQAAGPAAGTPARTTQRWRTWLWRRPAPGRRTVRFPAGDLFTAPLADQKQPRFHTTYQRWKPPRGTFDIASVGFGEDFGLVRWPRGDEGDGWQMGISGAVFAIFNLDTGSKDLLNADYIVGFPVSYRSGVWSARLRVFHQSSHLGDEFLLQPQDRQPVPQVPRVNLSYEALEFLASHEWRAARLYFGGSRIFASDTPLKRQRLQAGTEYRGNPLGWRTARLVAGLDVEAWEETGWDRDFSLKAGLMFRSPYGDARSVQVLVEYYNGHAPHGQFYPLNVQYAGLGIAYVF